MSAYDLDLHAWARAQADALRRRSANEIDWENVAEEIESLGKQERAELINRLHVLILHLLKWRYQPGLRTRSWAATIRVQRKELARHIRSSPSLKPLVAEAFLDAYETGRLAAVAETGLSEALFPEAPPFTAGQALEDDFWPEEITPSESGR
jgi:hypothetical protein